jgi:hypothetical protein
MVGRERRRVIGEGERRERKRRKWSNKLQIS